MADFTFANHGSITLLTPVSKAALDWCDAHIAEDRQVWGNAIAVEPRYVAPIVEEILAEGMTIDA